MITTLLILKALQEKCLHEIKLKDFPVFDLDQGNYISEFEDSKKIKTSCIFNFKTGEIVWIEIAKNTEDYGPAIKEYIYYRGTESLTEEVKAKAHIIRILC